MLTAPAWTSTRWRARRREAARAAHAAARPAVPAGVPQPDRPRLGQVNDRPPLTMHEVVNADLCSKTQAAQQIGPPRRGTNQPGRRAPARVLLSRFVEEVSYLSALRSNPVSHVLTDP